MNHTIILDLVAELAYRLAMSGAETFRVEESVNRILTAYGFESEVFAIPNCIIITLRTPAGHSATRLRRIGIHGNDLDAVERYNNLSRKICAEKPDPETAMQWLTDTTRTKVQYKLPLLLLGGFLGAAGFSIFFGATISDCLCAGLCGMIIVLAERFLDKFRTNAFFKTIASAFLMAFIAYVCGVLHISDNTDTVIIGGLMLLVPGLLITNAMRDIIFGDTNSGINRIIQVLLYAAAIALGTGAALKLTFSLWDAPVSTPVLHYGVLAECIAAMIACFGFTFLNNIHGPGMLLCALGGAIAWGAYSLAEHLGCSTLMCYFISSLIAAAYSEAMARIRKYPAISYLVMSIFPLIPGAGVYYTTNYFLQGDMANFAVRGKLTVAIAGVIAVGILIVSTIVRLANEWKFHRKK